MDFLKKLWPTPFNVKKGDVKSFVTNLIFFIIVCTVIGVLIGILSSVPILGVIFWILGSLLEIYGIVGAILCILVYLNII